MYLPLHFLKTEWWAQAHFSPQPENEKMRTRSQIPGFYNPQLSLKSIMETMTMFLKVEIGRDKKTSPIALKTQDGAHGYPVQEFTTVERKKK